MRITVGYIDCAVQTLSAIPLFARFRHHQLRYIIDLIIIEINGESTSTGSIGYARQQLAELCLPGNTRKELTMVVLRGTEEHKSHEMSVRVALGKIHPPHSVRDLSHGSVWAAHKAVHLADPLMYKISEAVVGLLKENR